MIVRKYLIFLYFLQPSKESASFIEYHLMYFWNILEDAITSDQNTIFDGELKDNGNNAWHGKSKSARTRSYEYTNASFDDPANIALWQLNSLENYDQSPSNHSYQA